MKCMIKKELKKTLENEGQTEAYEDELVNMKL